MQFWGLLQYVTLNLQLFSVYARYFWAARIATEHDDSSLQPNLQFSDLFLAPVKR